MLKQRALFLLGLISLVGSCKNKTPEPLKPTLLMVQVIDQQTRQPVDSALVVVSGTKGSYLAGRESQSFLQGYTDKQGRLQASMMIPRNWYATLNCGKLIKVGTKYKLYSMASIRPHNDELKREQENNYVAELDTLN